MQLDQDALIDRRVFRTTVIILATAAAAYAMWKLADLLLLVFACALIGLIFFNLARWMVQRTGLNFGIALALSVVGILATLAGAFWFFGNSLSGEFAELALRLPAAWEVFRARFAETPIGAEFFRRAGDLVPSGQSIVGFATGLLTSLGTIVSALAIVIVGGIYLAAQPRLYGKGVIMLTPESARGKVTRTFIAVAHSLNAWLLGQGIGMVFVGVATTLGLWLVGVPAAPAIGLVAGLCEFVPYLGTIVVVLPSVILAFGQSTTMGIWTIVVLVAVQQIQGNVVMPLLQSRMVELPPALTIFSLVALGVLLGPVGVILATPITVVAMVIVKAVYVNPSDLEPDEREELKGAS
ncbi:AI-2E family transporter [Sphingomonas sp. SUN039]|uniref:AI-2E family transporter n=1 Tax=Sphingomonas sp. SUN039 TaxID=2937787 RepID=UPI002164A65D|nr:AI-2E family transporter [Sphingomonas sp. SUN039]UVO55091.1 AI-2E family transporter [Sphingomonas sp. SUN039]